jgi:hypothetical protein
MVTPRFVDDDPAPGKISNDPKNVGKTIACQSNSHSYCLNRVSEPSTIPATLKLTYKQT